MSALHSVAILALLASAACNQNAQFTRHHAQLVADLVRHLHATCVCVLNADPPEFRHLRHALVSTRIYPSIMTLRIDNRGSDALDCRDNRPLVLMVASSARTWHYLTQTEQISSYPRWLLFADTAPSVSELMNRVNVPFDCEFLVAENRGEVIVLTEVYRVETSACLNLVHYGTWTKERGLQVMKQPLYERRKNLQGFTLRAAVGQGPPFNILRWDSQGKLHTGGFGGELWKVLEQQLNVTTEYVVPPDNAWGGLLPNGSWNGMVGMVHEKKVQLSLSGFTMLENRLHAVDFLIPILSTRMHILIRQPEGLTLEWTDLAAPLASGMWAATLGFILCAAVALLAARRGYDYYPSDALLQVFGLFCQQGSATVLLSPSSRAVFLMACMTSLVVVAAYSASLISLLTVQKKVLPFDSLRGFAADGSYRLGMIDKSAALALFQGTSDPMFDQIYKNQIILNPGGLVANEQDGVERICQEDKFAFLTSRLSASYFKKTLPCEITLVPESVLKDTISFIIAKGSPYRGILNHRLQRLRDSGMLNHLLKTTLPQAGTNLEQTIYVISLDDVFPVVLLLISGTILGVVMMILEHTWGL